MDDPVVTHKNNHGLFRNARVINRIDQLSDKMIHIGHVAGVLLEFLGRWLVLVERR